MRRIARVGALLAVCALAWSPAAGAADTTPGSDQIQFAAHEHDLGYRAYVAKQFDEAATHFENAFFAAPNPAELRSAVRARHDAGQLARAATLAAIGQRKYPDDAALGKLAEETVAEARPKVYEIHITSPDECNVAVDEKVVAAERVKDFRFFVDPGKHTLLVGWTEDRSLRVPIDARAGGTQALTLQAPPPPARPVESSTAGGGPEGPPPATKPLGPVVFLVGAGLTAVGVGVTIWSGIDTQNHPGTAAVRADCVGQGTSCPEYQQGLDAQLRTNILLAATGGVALVTGIIGVFFTQWSHADVPATTGQPRLRLEPAVGLGQAALKGTF
ncbi:MAG TPA: hypothetical protein VIF15_14910 [Polyangiaceae bacterium]